MGSSGSRTRENVYASVVALPVAAAESGDVRQAGNSATRRRRVRLDRRDVHVAREGAELVDVRAARIDGRAPAARREFLRAAGEHARHFHHGRAVLAVGFDVQRGDDREERDEVHGLARLLRAVAGHVEVVRLTHEDAIVAALEADHALGAVQAPVDRFVGAGEHRGDEEVLPLLPGRDLEVETRAHLVHVEHALLALGARGDDRGVGARIGFTLLAKGAGEAGNVRDATGGRLAGLSGDWLPVRGRAGCGVRGGAVGRRRGRRRLLGRLAGGERESSHRKRHGTETHWT